MNLSQVNTAGLFNLELDALQQYVAAKALNEKNNEEIPKVKEVFKASLIKAISGDFTDFEQGAALGSIILNDLKTKENQHKDRALELLSLMEGNY
jgi:hypothetical protein